MLESIIAYIRQNNFESIPEGCPVYPASVNMWGENCAVFMADAGDRDILVAPESAGFSGEPFLVDGTKWVAAEMQHRNAQVLRTLFPFTAPVPVLREKRSFGMGDRLGVATPGHLAAVTGYDAHPVLAQQSVRELRLTGRSFLDVLDDACFAVFREGYKDGYGADGDHLKSSKEVQYALDCGFSIITLDCGDYIHDNVNNMSDDEIDAAYMGAPELETIYIGRNFKIQDKEIYLDEMEYKRASLLYTDAIDFAEKIYKNFALKDRNVDFEVSIDEISLPTKPEHHFFIANEFARRGVVLSTMAPRFCGDFQKGVDYIGSVEQFEAELEIHAAIAEHFGYKLSLHSGSDKFSIFPAFGKITKGRFHVKTSGTSWLEAMELIAEKDPGLYREIHKFSLEHFEEARNYYHVTTDLNKVPDIDGLADAELKKLFSKNDARQLIHLNYGFILTGKNDVGMPLFRDRLYRIWRKYAEDYCFRLKTHMTKHLDLLYKYL